MRLLVYLLAAASVVAADLEPISLTRLHPLGGSAGTSVEVEILGARLDRAAGVEFDCADLVWKHTIRREAERLTGIVWIAPDAALGGHMLSVLTSDGPTTSLLFNVGQYPSMVESEQRTVTALPVEIYGRLEGAVDSDQYWFAAKAGERWVFDLLAMEHGSAVESRMMLLDKGGELIAFNDDRDHFDENPLIEHTFVRDGVYAVKVDQYRGPRGFTFGKNNGYVLRISALPRVLSVAPLGARRGTQVRFVILGSALDRAERVYLTELRRGEYSRMTYPYTMPIRFRPDPPRATSVARIDGRIIEATDGRLEATFAIPAGTTTGLWHLWVAGPNGVASGPKIEIGDLPESAEAEVSKSAQSVFPYVVNGSLGPKERDRYPIQGKAGVPIHVATLSAQLGGPYLDTVLTLRDASGRKLAENDDVVAGWGGLLGNPDSSLYYTPAQGGRLLVEVRDRLNRGGPAFPYRMKVDRDKPGFQLFTTPENFTAKRGGTGTVKVHLAREAGFEGEVEVWIEGLPPDVTPPHERFRADQTFEPNADGADMIIPEIRFQVRAPAEARTYPIRIFGKAADGATAEAQTATMIGPIYSGNWNYYRRPVPSLTFTVVE